MQHKFLQNVSVGFLGAPNNGTPCPYYSHTTPIRIPKDMGMVWEYGKLTIRGSHYWESLESPLNVHAFHTNNLNIRNPPMKATTTGCKNLNGKKQQQTNTKHVPLSIHVVVSNMFYFDWGNDPIGLIFFRWVVFQTHQNVGIQDVFFQGCDASNHGLLCDGYHDCLCIDVGFRRHGAMGWLERLGLGKDVWLGVCVDIVLPFSMWGTFFDTFSKWHVWCHLECIYIYICFFI